MDLDSPSWLRGGEPGRARQSGPAMVTASSVGRPSSLLVRRHQREKLLRVHHQHAVCVSMAAAEQARQLSPLVQ